jgi:hypothetical protein
MLGDGMRRPLLLHPDFVCPSIASIEVEVDRFASDMLELRYLLRGAIEQLAIPPAAASQRTDGLWQHSCFEAFVRGRGRDYFELNLSPSGQWAAYHFDAYRAGMRDEAAVPPPAIETETVSKSLLLRARIDLRDVSERLPEGSWRLGLSAVMEEIDGNKSYWALAHPPGKADFHHDDCFALNLPAAKQS